MDKRGRVAVLSDGWLYLPDDYEPGDEVEVVRADVPRSREPSVTPLELTPISRVCRVPDESS
jgi:hypothetical protein